MRGVGPLLTRLGVLALLLVPLAAGRSIDIGPLHAEVTPEATSDCTVPLDEEFCLATWDQAGTPETPGDDSINATRAVERVAVSIEGEVGPTQEASLDTREILVEHPLNPLLNATWLEANESLPEHVRSLVRLETRSWGLVMDTTSPVPVPFPNTQGEYTGSTVPVYIWDCGQVFTEHASGDQWCSYGGVHPIPEGATAYWDTDSYPALVPFFLACSGYRDITPDACPVLDLGEATGNSAASEWRNITPNASFGASVREVEASVSPSATAGDRREALGGLSRTQGARPLLPAGTRLPSEPTPLPPPDPHAVPAAEEHVEPRLPSASPPVATAAARQAPHSDRPTLVVAAAAAAGALLLLAAALYHRILRHNALRNENRRRILDLIRETPGTRAGTIAAKMALHHGTVRSHLDVLQRLGLVEVIGDGQKRYFVAGVATAKEKSVAVAGSSPVTQAILQYLAGSPRVEFATLCKALGLGKSTVSMALSRLEASGVVRRQRQHGRLWVEALRSP